MGYTQFPVFKRCDSCKKPMPISNPHSSCLRCLGETHISDNCRISKSFKPQMKKERDIQRRALLMESVLTPEPSRSDFAPSIAASVWSVPLAPFLDHRRSPSPVPTGKRKKMGRGCSAPRKDKERAEESRNP